jgi:tRNA(Arg) A34 adenosine deaminase TadA
MLLPKRIQFELPDWIFTECDLERRRPSDEERMDLAIELARRNIEHGGGPFGAVIFDGSGAVVAPGVNLVVPLGSSLLHAEVVALVFAQAHVGSFTLAGDRHELFASSEPCVQCLGATHWSGVSRLVCGAPVEMAEVAGFNEGPRRDDWKEQLANNNVAVVTGLKAELAGQVLTTYAARGGLRYNARSP